MRRKKKSNLFESLFGQEEIFESNELTDDKVFLLSNEGTEKYFPNNDERMCKATEYAVKNGVYVADNGYSCWWLRFPDPNYSYRVYYVDNFGLIDYNYVCNNIYVVRPTLWINL